MSDFRGKFYMFFFKVTHHSINCQRESKLYTLYSLDALTCFTQRKSKKKENVTKENGTVKLEHKFTDYPKQCVFKIT